MKATRQKILALVADVASRCESELRYDSYMPGKERLYRMEVIEDGGVEVMYPMGARMNGRDFAIYLEGFADGLTERDREKSKGW